MWYILQGLIMFAVIGSNIHWQWTPNPYVAGTLGAVAAFVTTALLGDLIGLLRRLRKRSTKPR